MRARLKYADKPLEKGPFNGEFIDFERIPAIGEIISISSVKFLEVVNVVSILTGWKWEYTIFVKDIPPIVL